MAKQRPNLTAIAVVAAALILASGSAYAGQAIAKNAVRSPQVKNNTLTTVDVKNNSLRGGDVKQGSIAKRDLAVGTVPDVYTFIGTVPGDNVARTVLTIPNFSSFETRCSATSDNIFVSFGPPSPIPPSTPKQLHGVQGSDISDHQPVGGATLIGQAGGVGMSNSGGVQPTAGIIFQGEYWGRSSTRLAHGSWSLSFPSASGCSVRIQVTVERLATAEPIPRTGTHSSLGPSGCEATGVAFCTMR